MATVNYLRDGKPKCSVEKPSSALTASIKTCNIENKIFKFFCKLHKSCLLHNTIHL